MIHIDKIKKKKQIPKTGQGKYRYLVNDAKNVAKSIIYLILWAVFCQLNAAASSVVIIYKGNVTRSRSLGSHQHFSLTHDDVQQLDIVLAI